LEDLQIRSERTLTVYDPNGNAITTGSTVSNRFMFGGREWYQTLGLYNFRNRFYLPSLGRFLQPDPIGFTGDPANLYRYCGNNPVNFSDPTGEYFREPRWNADGSVTIEIPVSFEGPGNTPQARGNYRCGVESLSGEYNGVYVSFGVADATMWESLTGAENKVYFNEGFGGDGYGSTGSGAFGRYQTSYVYADGGNVFGQIYSALQGAAHEVLHFLGFTDGYNPQTGDLLPGVDPSDILGDIDPDGVLTDEEIRQILYDGGGRGGHGQGRNSANINNGTNGVWGNPAYMAGSALSQYVPTEMSDAQKKREGH
jgi:RHS repeat-associated protein